MKKVVLKEGKERSLLRRHPWIFSGALEAFPLVVPGEILPVFTACGKFLAQAYFHPTNSIAGRVVSFEEGPVESIIKKRLKEAIALREKHFSLAVSTACRLVNAEGDGLPGLVVDRYADVLVLQIHTAGMERLKAFILKALIEFCKPLTIYEKSVSASRELEGLKESEGVLFGQDIHEIEIHERGLRFLVSVKEGQKSGFFLDQREMRALLSGFSAEKRVLNCFSYTGAFSLFALQGGATFVESVDTSESALKWAKKNTELNRFSLEKHSLVQEDVFAYLKRQRSLDFEIAILDPPAFAKKRGDVENACRGYQEINRLVLEKLPPGALLFTSSCSQYIDETLFQQVLFSAALEAGREVKILSKHIHAIDHPVSLYHPEGHYLKSLVLSLS